MLWSYTLKTSRHTFLSVVSDGWTVHGLLWQHAERLLILLLYYHPDSKEAKGLLLLKRICLFYSLIQTIDSFLLFWVLLKLHSA